MNSKLAFIIGAILGAAAGFASGYFAVKGKFQKYADDQIESMKAAQKDHDEFIKKLYSDGKEVKSDTIEPSKPAVSNVSDILQPSPNGDYYDYVHPNMGLNNPTRKKERASEYEPDVDYLDEDEFADSDLDTVTLYYYADGVFADEDGNVVGNLYDHCGLIVDIENSLDGTHGDCVHIRNNTENIVYEILLSQKRWYDEVATPTQRASVIRPVRDHDDD